MRLFCIEAEKHYGMGAIISIIDIEKKNCPPPIQRAVHITCNPSNRNSNRPASRVTSGILAGRLQNDSLIEEWSASGLNTWGRSRKYVVADCENALFVRSTNVDWRHQQSVDLPSLILISAQCWREFNTIHTHAFYVIQQWFMQN